MHDAELDSELPPTPSYRYAELLADELFLAGQVPRGRSGAIAAVAEAGDP